MTATRPLRFTHTAKLVDAKFSGYLGGAYVLAQRMVNVAPQALASTDANIEAAGRINDENANGTWHAWDNGPRGGVQTVSPQHPVDVMLIWPRPVTVAGLNALWAGFAAAEVQIFRDATGRQPREAADADWQTIRQWEKLENQYPRGLGVNWLDFGQAVTTRAIRLRINQATREGHGHLLGKTDEGRRVWLGELAGLAAPGRRPLGVGPAAALRRPPQCIHPSPCDSPSTSRAGSRW